MMKKIIYIGILFFAFTMQNVSAQTCGCAGTDFASIDVTGWTVGQIGTITTCQWGGERSTIYNTVAGATYRVSSCGAGYDTQLEIYTTGCTFIAYNDDFGPACGTTEASVDFVSPGGNLYSRLSEFYCTSNFTCTGITIQLLSLPPSMPVINASCSSAQSASSNISGTDNCGFRAGFDQTVQVNIPTTGNWTFSTCGGASFDTYLYLSTGVCTGLLAQNDDACGLQSTITVASLAAGTYYIDVEGFSAPAGGEPFTLTVTGSCPVDPCVGDVTSPTFSAAGGVDQQQLTNNACMANFAQVDLAQSFIPTQTSICGAEIELTANASGTGNVTIQLVSTLGGPVLATGTATGVSDGTWVAVTWPSVAITPGNTYYLVFTGTNPAHCIAGDLYNSYGSGQVYANAGYGSWPTYDYTFKTTGCGAGACPSNISTTVTAGSCNASVVTPNPTASDNCAVSALTWSLSGATTVSSAPTGINYVGTQTFNAGVTTVTYTASDAAGNTALCSFTVTVTDNQNPTITCPATVNTTTNSGCTATGVSLGSPSTGDNCTVAGVTNNAPASFPLGATTVTWTVTDVAGNTATCTQTVNVTDNTVPTITCPSAVNTTTNTGCTATGVSLGTPTTADNCSVPTVTNNAPAAFPIGVTTVTWTATDAAGNSATCTQTVTVTDNIVPTITCPSTVNTTTNSGCTATGVSLGTPVTADNCGVPTVTNNAPAAFPLGATTVTWTATDAAGNTATCTQTVNVTDGQNPTITCSANMNTTTGAGICTASISTIDPTIGDNCGVAALTWTMIGATTGTSAASGINNLGTQTFNSGTTTITYIVYDAANNSATCSFNVTVADNQAPVPNVATLPAASGQCAASVTAPTATDNCAATITATTSDPVSYTVEGTYTITWTYNDGNGNTTTQTQTVTVDDNIAPVPVIGSLPDATGGCSVTITAPSATDNCAGTITATTTDPTFYDTQGTYTVTWTYNDGNGNVSTQSQTVIVSNSVPPVADLASLPTETGACSATVSTTPTATDNCGGLVIGTTSDALTYNLEGTYTITWTYNDVYGNASTQTQTVIVDDVLAPVPDNATLVDATGECTAFIATAPTATDDCIGLITGTTIDPLSYNVEGTYSVTWTYNDGNGNVTTQTQTIIVDDVTAPVPSLASLPDATGGCSVTLSAPTANDNCAGTITATTSDPLTYNTQGTFTVTWTYDDANGNISTQTQTVIVSDNTAPVPDNASLTTIMGECSAVVSTAPTATDDCNGAITGTTADPLTYSAEGTYTITWTFDDGGGNISTQTQTVIVDDVTAPVTPVLANETGACSATPTAPTTTDACAGTITGTTSTIFPITTQGTTIVTWTFDDGNGNITTADQNVIISDDTAPFADVAFLPTLSGCSVTITTTPTGIDNCTGPVTGTTSDPLTYSAPGTYTVTWSYADGNGNVSTQTQTINVIDCSGIEGQEIGVEVSLYPNPSDGIFTITLSEMPKGNTEVHLLTTSGQILYTGLLQNQSQQFDFSHLSAAIYYLQIITEDGSLTKQIIIKNNY